MRSPALVIVTVFLVAAVSGCAAAPSTPAGTPGAPAAAPGVPSTEGLAPGARPTWTHGDWFEINVKVDLGFGTLIDGKHKLVVGRADTTGYALYSATRPLGVVDAHFDDFYVGPMDLDLNGLAGPRAKPFRTFEWPLELGRSWTIDVIESPIGGSEYVQGQFTVVREGRVTDPKGEAPGFEVQGKTGNGHFINYTYSSQAKWLTKYEKRTPTGALRVYFELTDYGANYTGEFHTVTMKPLYQRFILNPFWVFDASIGPVPPVDQFTVSTDFTFMEEIIFLFTFTVPKDGNVPELTAPGAVHVETVFPDNAHKEHTLADSGNKAQFFLKDHEPYKKGAYSVGYAVAGLSGAFVGYYAFTDVVTKFTGQSHAHH